MAIKYVNPKRLMLNNKKMATITQKRVATLVIYEKSLNEFCCYYNRIAEAR